MLYFAERCKGKADTWIQIYSNNWMKNLLKTYFICGCSETSGACEIRQVDESYLTCEDRGKWLQGVKRTFQSARLHCTRQQLEHTILRDETDDNVTLSKCKSDSWACVKRSPAVIYSLITTLPLCGQWFQRKHSSGGRLLSHRHRHVFDCSCGRPWQSLHTPTGTSTVRKRASMKHIYSVIERVYCTYCSDFL